MHSDISSDSQEFILKMSMDMSELREKARSRIDDCGGRSGGRRGLVVLGGVKPNFLSLCWR